MSRPEAEAGELPHPGSSTSLNRPEVGEGLVESRLTKKKKIVKFGTIRERADSIDATKVVEDTPEVREAERLSRSIHKARSR